MRDAELEKVVLSVEISKLAGAVIVISVVRPAPLAVKLCEAEGVPEMLVKAVGVPLTVINVPVGM